VTGAAALRSGDAVTLGNGAATLTIDPNGLGLIEAVDEPAAPVARPNAESAGPPEVPAPVVTRVADAPRTPPPAPLPTPASQEEGIGWEPAPSQRFYTPKRQGLSPGALTATILLTAVVVGAGTWWIYGALQKREATGPTVIVVKPPADTQPATAPTRVNLATREAARSSPAPAPTRPAPPPRDPRKDDPDWQAVEMARNEDPVVAVVKFDDYLHRFPDTPYKADLDRYADEAADRLWWRRIIELFEDRDTADKEIADRRMQLKQSQDPEFKKMLEAEIAQFTDRRNDVTDMIQNKMAYKRPGPPNLYDSGELQGLRKERDAQIYEAWRKQVLDTIRRSRGQKLPWRSSR
jgi:hypothetical protein